MAKPKREPAAQDLSPADRMSHYLRQAEKTVEQSKRGKQSLSGNNVYAERFHEYRTLVTSTFRELRATAAAIASPGLERTLIDIESELTYFFNPRTSQADRRDLRRHIEVLVK